MAGQTFQPGVAVMPATQVEISVSCRNLKDKDVFSKSDPMCVLYTKDLGTDKWREVGRTEMVKDNLNPEFVKKFVMNYYFEESQKLKFDLYDVDSPSSRLEAHDHLGCMECTLGQIFGSPGCRLDDTLRGAGRNCGTITVRAEEIANCKDIATLQFQAHKLDKKDFFGKSDPYLVFYRSNEDGSYTVVHKTEVIKNTLNPTWRPFSVKVRVLCNGDYDRMIKVECYDWDSDGGHDLIGEFFTTMKQLSTPGSDNVYDVVHPKKKAKKKSYKNSGTVSLMSCRIDQVHSFLDYIRGGMQMNFTVAIDFTASNGNPAAPTSLHYMNPYQPNQYACALKAVGEIIQDYDSDKMFPALGFGARIPPNGMVSHEFALNLNMSNPFCHGISGVLQAYQNILPQVQLYGPTNFAPVIQHVSRFAAASRDGSNYFVLLIITDGVISDMPTTKEAIVAAAALPMSIIIVGVGDADFSAMEELDGDDVRISSRGRYAERDIVQFVPFREFVGGRYGSNLQVSQAYLAKEVLAEIPDQVTSYMTKNGIKPKPPRPEITTPAEPGHSSSGTQQQGYPPPGAGGPAQGYPPPPGTQRGPAPPSYNGPAAGYPPPSTAGGPGSAPYPTGQMQNTGMAPFPPPPRSTQPPGHPPPQYGNPSNPQAHGQSPSAPSW